jgi:hypothetical protein
MSARIVLDGFQDLLRQLNTMEASVRAEAHAILLGEATGGSVELIQSYKRKTGNLASRVRVIEEGGDVVGAVIVSASPHSHLYHWGTGERRTAKGANRGRGPRANPEPLVPIARRRRARAQRRLVEMLERKGFEVSGS